MQQKNEKNHPDAGYVEMEFAKPDTDREARTGFPEVVFCSGKADAYLVQICEKLLQTQGCLLGTRASQHQYEVVREKLPQVQYNPISGILKIPGKNAEPERAEAEETEEESGTGLPYIAICTAGTADIFVAEEAAETALFFGSRIRKIYDVGVSGIHRLLAKKTELQGACCTIAVAGMEGALPSVIGGLVKNPVIAVPTSVGYGANFGGLSALLTMINSCANGITVVNIDNGYGAGYVASQIWRLSAGNTERK